MAAGPQLLGQVLFNKQIPGASAAEPPERHLRQRRHRLGVSTLADWVGAATATLMPLVNEIEKRVLAADRIHTDDTTVPVLAEGTCMTGRLWTYVRDDAPSAGEAAPAALFHYSPTHGAEHPEKHLAGYSQLMQADAYAGYKNLYARPPS